MGNVPGKTVANSDAGTADLVGGNDWDDLVAYMNGTDKTGPVVINTDTRFRSGKLKFRDTGNNHNYIHNFQDLAADRTVTWPLLTGNDSPTFDAHDSTLTNKTIDVSNNEVRLRMSSAHIFKSGSTYFARKYDGSLIDSDTNAEIVINAAIAAVPFGEIFFAEGQYDLPVAFAGFDPTAGQRLIFNQNTNINVPEGYTGYVFRFFNTGFGGGIYGGGGYLAEQGTPQQLWTGVLLESDTGDGVAFLRIRDLYFYLPGTGIDITTHPGGFCNGNIFEDIIIDGPVIGVEFNQDTGGLNESNFIGVQIQAGGNTTHGFKDIQDDRHTFVGCHIYDGTGIVEANILSDADFNVIIGGHMTGQFGTFVDDSATTTIHDWHLNYEPLPYEIKNDVEDLLILNRNGNAANNDVWGMIFKGKNSSGTVKQFADIQVFIEDAGAANEYGAIQFNALVDSAEQNIFYVDYAGMYFGNGADNQGNFDLSNQTAPHTWTMPNATALLIGNDSSDVTIADGKDFAFSTSTGSKFGTGTTQKIGFFNHAPVAQQTGIADVDSSTVDNTYGQQENDVITSLRTKVNAILAVLEAMGFTAIA